MEKVTQDQVDVAADVYAREIARAEIARERDAKFDGGQFSGPLHEILLIKAHRRARHLAASRSGLTRSVVSRIIRSQNYWEIVEPKISEHIARLERGNV